MLIHHQHVAPQPHDDDDEHDNDDDDDDDNCGGGDDDDKNHNSGADTPPTCGTTTCSDSISIALKSKDYRTAWLFSSERKHKMVYFY